MHVNKIQKRHFLDIKNPTTKITQDLGGRDFVEGGILGHWGIDEGSNIGVWGGKLINLLLLNGLFQLIPKLNGQLP